MVTVLKGGINQGKTTKILAIYNQKKSGDGFVTRKVFEKGFFIGYEIVRLSSMERKPFIFITGYEPNHWAEDFRYGPFTFSKEAIAFAESMIDEILKSGTGPVYIDEIGPVELQGKGFYKLFKMALKSGRNLFVTIREAYIDDVLRLFKINDYQIIDIKELQFEEKTNGGNQTLIKGA